MRAPIPLLAGALLAAGCGGEEPRRPATPVRVAVTAPSDGAVVRSGSVEVAGTVRPADADVRVLGRTADVDDGRFTVRIPLRPGANVVDVSATAAERAPGLVAIRVVRELSVRVPDVQDLPVAEATEALRARGLGVEVRERGGLFDDLLPGAVGVCSTDPGAGARVRPGATVTLTVAKAC